MANTNIIITNFTGTYANLNGNRETIITKLDIARGIVSIGKLHWNEYLKSPGKTFFDFFHELTGFMYYVNVKPKLIINQNFTNLDPTDKGLKSYSIGMGVSKIVGERVLGINCLQHVDKLIEDGIITFTTVLNQRGDMVGLDGNLDWHVIEAKGRTSRPYITIKTQAKNQVNNIDKINGIKPKTKCYCIIHINNKFSEIFLNDPDDKPMNRIE